MTKIFLLLGLCLTYVLTVSAATTPQVCNPEMVEESLQCDEVNIGSHEEEHKKLAREAKECFRRNHCESEEEEEHEKHEREEHERHEREHSGSGEKHCEEEKRHRFEEKRRRECHEEVEDKEHEEVSKCVKEKTGFRLPKRHPGHKHRGCEEHEEQHHSSEHHSGSGEREVNKTALREKMFAEFNEKLAKDCKNNETNIKNVKQCLFKDGKTEFAQTAGFCATRHTCAEMFEHGACSKEYIKDLHKAVKAAEKTCSEEFKTKANFEALYKGAKKCEHFNHTHEAEDHHKRHGCHKEGSGSGHHSGHHSGSGSGHRDHKRREPHHIKMGKVCEMIEKAEKAIWEKEHPTAAATGTGGR